MEKQANLVSGFQSYLEYGVLGLSAILALLGAFIMYKTISEEHPDAIKIGAAKYFLGFSLVFLVVSAAVKISDRYFAPAEANIVVEIEPWNERDFSSRSINRDFYIKTPDGSEKYGRDGVKVHVKDDSSIRCLVYPLHDRINQLRDQLTYQVINNNDSAINKDGGIGGL